MKKYFLSICLLAISGFLCTVSAQNLMEQLASMPRVCDVQKLESTVFPEKYLIIFEQPIDHSNPAAGTFKQRVFICNVHPDSATVVVCEGYGAQYAMRPGYRDEVSRIFNTNNIVVEHRYFLESIPFEKGTAPEDVNWNYLTTRNGAGDLHDVVTALKALYSGKWISTGISKGGQTTALYRWYYPEDVDISVPYVAPLCRDAQDGRHEPFIADFVGTPSDRKKVKDFQTTVLKRRKAIQPWIDSVSKANQYEFNIPIEEVYDYCALEFSFAFWQWGAPVADIPSKKATDREVFNYLMQISDPSYFVSWSPTSPFFVQAAKELGYYGYDTAPFKRYLKIKSADGYLQTLFMPKGWTFTFDDNIYESMTEFIRTTDKKMLFIYGEFDPWSAVKVEDPHTPNVKVFVDPAGSHRARIGTFPEDTQKEIISILSGWLYD